MLKRQFSPEHVITCLCYLLRLGDVHSLARIPPFTGMDPLELFDLQSWLLRQWELLLTAKGNRWLGDALGETSDKSPRREWSEGCTELKRRGMQLLSSLVSGKSVARVLENRSISDHLSIKYAEMLAVAIRSMVAHGTHPTGECPESCWTAKQTDSLDGCHCECHGLCHQRGHCIIRLVPPRGERGYRFPHRRYWNVRSLAHVTGWK